MFTVLQRIAIRSENTLSVKLCAYFFQKVEIIKCATIRHGIVRKRRKKRLKAYRNAVKKESTDRPIAKKWM